MNIYLIGMMASGKSTVGRLLAAKLGRRFYDSDRLVEKKRGMSVSAIFAGSGEAAFRRFEREAIRRLAKKKRAVVATGGGAPCFKENWRQFRKSGRVVYLKASAAVILKRLGRKGKIKRPLLSDHSALKKRILTLLKERNSAYRKADITINTDGKNPADIARILCKRLK